MNVNSAEKKPIIGITCGDINGVGPEVIIKTLSDNRILDLCHPVVFCNNKVLNFYRKSVPDYNFTFTVARNSSEMNMKQVNVFNCWEEDVQVQPGELTDIAGKMAVLSLNVACDALKAGKLDGIVTAPFHKANVQSPEFDYTGHTPFLKQFFGLKDVTMMLVADNMKVAVLTEHIPVQAVAGAITKEAILYKLKIIQESLIQDFGISKPKIAVLGLNPHAGDGGLVGKEEIDIIAPAIKEAKEKGILCMGPYSADAFFARGQYQSFDVVLAMYHDQGLIPFKSLAFGEGINYTAGMPVIRTSPDHGTAFDIAGKGIADESSFRQAIFTCIDIYRARHERAEQTKNPLKKITAAMLRNAVDEKIEG